ncbi:MAG: isoprenylcysteine carboxylmethyltransferase family protein [Candidatus Cloacimonas acidaminovorans]|jgi:protein-S-isoprenylcysteine O-methyltransferase Ste14|nr:isoprenylcysteine carboxylmethyltransferase family protein [Candidatus Cloacimonas acidaminovorans]
MIANIYIVAFLILYFLIVFITPSIRVKRKTGINPYVFKNTDSAHDFLGKVSAPITSLIFIVALVNLFYPEGLQYFAPFTWLEISILKYTGFAIIHFALLWIIVAQVQMSNSWRVGIDHSAKTELKTNGLFSVSRNPVFLGMLVTLAGIFFILPNAITLLVATVSVMLFQVQVRLEEEYLSKTHANTYIVYCKKVRRWI